MAAAGIDAWRCYRAIEGPLQSALLALYVLVALLPALIVMDEYVNRDPSALARGVVHHYGLSAATAGLLRGVLVSSRNHETGSALLAIAGALFFGLGFGRVLELVYGRAWGVSSLARPYARLRYAAVLLSLYGLVLLLLVQARSLATAPGLARLALAPGWALLMTAFFFAAGRAVTYGDVGRSDLLWAAVPIGAGIVVLMLVSGRLLDFWINFYAQDYGGLGVVMALFFWIGFACTLIVACAAAAPSFAHRHEQR